MAIEMFLKLSGCEGESIATGHEKESELLSYNFGVSNTGSSAMGGGSGTGKASFNDVALTKKIDSSTNAILENCAKGKHFDTATITIRKVGGDKPLEYYVFTMDQVFVSSVNHSGNPGDEETMEHVTLNFEKMDVTYQPQTATGSAGGDIKFKWDIRKNQEA